MKGKKLLIVLLCVFIGASLACSYSITKNDENDSSEISKKNGIKLPHYGAYFIDGNDYAEIQENQGAPSSDANSNNFLHTKQQPIISLWYPNVNVDYLEIRSLTLSSPVKFYVTPNQNDKEILDIQPTSPLSSGLYCLILGNPIASPNDIPYWCFLVDDQYAINNSESSSPTQQSNLPITPAPTSTPTSNYIFIPYDDPSEKAISFENMAWRPDSSIIAIVYNPQFTGTETTPPGHIFFYDSTTGDLINEIDYLHEYGIADLAWSPDGDKIATLDGNGRLVVRYYETNEIILDIQFEKFDQFGRDLDWSEKGNLLAIAHRISVTILDTRDWKEIQNIQVYKGTAFSGKRTGHVAISPSEELIAINKHSDALTMWDIETGEMTAEREGWFEDIAWSSQGESIAAVVLKGDWNYGLLFFDPTLEYYAPLSPTGNGVLSWCPTNNDYLIVGAENYRSGVTQIYELVNGKPIMNFSQYDRFYSLIWSPDGSKLVGRGETGIYIFPIDNLLP